MLREWSYIFIFIFKEGFREGRPRNGGLRMRSFFAIRGSSTQKSDDVLEPVLIATKKYIMHDGGDLEGNRLFSPDICVVWVFFPHVFSF